MDHKAQVVRSTGETTMQTQKKAKRFLTAFVPIVTICGVFLAENRQTISRSLEAEDARFSHSDRVPRMKNSDVHSKTCLELRGTSGTWVQDWSYANRTTYKPVGDYFPWHTAQQNFTSSPGQPFRNAASWRWQDDNCPVSEVTLPGLCGVSYELNVSQYLFLGDSLTSELSHSMQGLLGFPPMGRRAKFRGQFLPLPIHCPATDDYPEFQLTLRLVRVSPLKDLLGLRSEAETFRSGKSAKKGLARQFIDGADPSKKTLIVTNTGAWMHSMDEYRQAFDALLFWIDSLDADKVIIFYRETIPGHADCRPNNQTAPTSQTHLEYNWQEPVVGRPYHNYTEFATVTHGMQDSAAQQNMSDMATEYRWNLFEEYNEYSRNILFARRKYTSSAPDANERTLLPSVHWLNVYNSSVLRRDGHVGFGDCLHYYLPGPPDWWSHFVYSTLLDMAATGSQQQQESRHNTSGAELSQ